MAITNRSTVVRETTLEDIINTLTALKAELQKKVDAHFGAEKKVFVLLDGEIDQQYRGYFGYFNDASYVPTGHNVGRINANIIREVFKELIPEGKKNDTVELIKVESLLDAGETKDVLFASVYVMAAIKAHEKMHAKQREYLNAGRFEKFLNTLAGEQAVQKREFLVPYQMILPVEHLAISSEMSALWKILSNQLLSYANASQASRLSGGNPYMEMYRRLDINPDVVESYFLRLSEGIKKRIPIPAPVPIVAGPVVIPKSASLPLLPPPSPPLSQEDSPAISVASSASPSPSVSPAPQEETKPNIELNREGLLYFLELISPETVGLTKELEEIVTSKVNLIIATMDAYCAKAGFLRARTNHAQAVEIKSVFSSNMEIKDKLVKLLEVYNTLSAPNVNQTLVPEIEPILKSILASWQGLNDDFVEVPGGCASPSPARN